MTIALTTPIQQPAMHGQAAATFGEVKIIQVRNHIVDKQLELTCEYGDTVDGDWVPAARLPTSVHSIQNIPQLTGPGGVIVEADPVYDLFMLGAFASSTSTFLYDEVASSLYQYLIDEGIYDGSIV